MATAKQYKARTRIYERGLKLENPNNKQGWSIDHSQPADDEDKLVCEAGDLYWRWQHRDGPTEFSLEEPGRITLTSDPILKLIWATQDSFVATIRHSPYIMNYESACRFYMLDLTFLGVRMKNMYLARPEFIRKVGEGLVWYNRMHAFRAIYDKLEDVLTRYKGALSIAAWREEMLARLDEFTDFQ